jgi:hypothetical protein
VLNLVDVRKWNYGEYSSGNYGAHTVAVDVGSLTLYFSYNTVVAFRDNVDFQISENVWSRTTGKHLNWLDPDKSKRLPNSEFEERLENVLRRHGLTVRR